MSFAEVLVLAFLVVVVWGSSVPHRFPWMAVPAVILYVLAAAVLRGCVA